MKSYWIYILYCSNNTYYTGYTTDLKRRYQEHLQGSVKCKYTRSFKPLKIAQSWSFTCDLRVVLRLEHWIKTLPRRGKEHLISNPTLLLLQFKNIESEKICL